MNDLPTFGDQLWKMHTGLSHEGIVQLIDLFKIPSKMKEVEMKYRIISSRNISIDEAISELFARIGAFIKKRKLKVDNLSTFVGIDQYCLFVKGEKEFHLRYRSGANRPPQLTVKYQLQKGSNTVRGEINLAVEHADPQNVRAFISFIAVLAGDPVSFSIQQSGEIWVILDPKSNQKVEIVVYRVKRFAPRFPDGKTLEGAFIEIEPLGFSRAGEAITVIKQYEKELELGSSVCDHSVAEMFKPGGLLEKSHLVR